VAEQPSVYGGDQAVAQSFDSRTWVAPGELADLRRRSEAAIALLKKGQRKSWPPSARQAIGGLSRRGIGLTSRHCSSYRRSSRGAGPEERSPLSTRQVLRRTVVRRNSAYRRRNSQRSYWIDLARHRRGKVSSEQRLPLLAGSACPRLSLRSPLCLFWKGQCQTRGRRSRSPPAATQSHILPFQ
jgi:hypothetical protein